MQDREFKDRFNLTTLQKHPCMECNNSFIHTNKIINQMLTIYDRLFIV